MSKGGRVQGSGVQGSGFRVQGFKVQGSRAKTEGNRKEERGKSKDKGSRDRNWIRGNRKGGIKVKNLKSSTIHHSLFTVHCSLFTIQGLPAFGVVGSDVAFAWIEKLMLI